VTTLSFATIPGLHDRLADGRARITSLVADSLDTVARLNPAYRAFSHLADDAMTQAHALQAALDAGRSRGPLHGLPVSVKGNIPVAGLPWTEGTRIHASRMAPRDADIVQRVRAAGGIVLGTTTLSELAMYGVTNAFEPMALNPWDTARTAGGSSTGAGVACALGITPVNIGTDSGGSIRNPACHCGVVGFMPRIGGLSTEGKANHTPSLSSVGLIGRCVVDVETAWDVLSELPGTRVETPRRRLLVLRELIDTMCDDETLELFAAACRRLLDEGFELVDGEVPGWMAGEHAAGVVSLFESGLALAHMDISLASDGIRLRATNAARLDAATVDAARAACESLRRSLLATLQSAGASAVLTPTWPFAAPGLETQSLVVRGRTVPIDPHRNCFVRAANAVDACAISLPMGLYPGARVPAGVHLIAPGGDERTLLALARIVEGCLPALPALPAV
jgi:Asp-tRNA(Asn)/Glu-tRNA(Gln) amidotransferase A subunit family amidase